MRRPWPELRHYLDICLEEMMINRKIPVTLVSVLVETFKYVTSRTGSRNATHCTFGYIKDTLLTTNVDGIY
jgi:hypothetical protein